MNYAICKTDVGWSGVGIEDGAITYVTIMTTREDALKSIIDAGADEPAPEGEAAPLVKLVQQVAAGKSVELNGRMKIVGGTAFQRSVWKALESIPHGATVSYGDIARKVGRPKAARAVGHAVGSNPLPLLLPCHRVLASDGSIGGFGGGLPMKRALLRNEGVAV